jgi:hypothetical protein
MKRFTVSFGKLLCKKARAKMNFIESNSLAFLKGEHFSVFGHHSDKEQIKLLLTDTRDFLDPGCMILLDD